MVNNFYNKMYKNRKTIQIIHKAGFFSSCSVKLTKIVNFLNSEKKLPDIIDSSKLFIMYKKKEHRNRDITFDFFQNYDDIIFDYNFQHINYHWEYQFKKYTDIDYKSINLLIKKYFSPSIGIKKIINNLEKKYNIEYENTLSVYFRGTDKKKETKLPKFEEFYKQIIELINIKKNINILIQTDTIEFIKYMNSKNLKNVFTISENKVSNTQRGIHNEQSGNLNYEHMFNFLSTVIIISRCRYIVCNSGNCSLWMLLYRGNAKNIVQYLKGEWYSSICE